MGKEAVVARVGGGQIGFDFGWFVEGTIRKTLSKVGARIKNGEVADGDALTSEEDLKGCKMSSRSLHGQR